MTPSDSMSLNHDMIGSWAALIYIYIYGEWWSALKAAVQLCIYEKADGSIFHWSVD